MATVNSVSGPLDTSELGFTLCHEHVMTSSAGVAFAYPELVNRADTVENAVTDLAATRAEGVSTFVDLTTFDLGRDVRALEEVARRSGMQIIAATGTWLEVPRIFWQMGPDVVASLYVRELQEGIDGSGIRAGIIKVANDVGGVTERGEVILRAAARAQRETGVPIYTHTWAVERVGEQQIAIFEEEGVDLDRVCIGHSNDASDTDYLLGILEKGCWLGLDRYPGDKPGTPGWEERTRIVKSLIDAGYSHRLILSHDHTVVHGIVAPETRAERHRSNPDGFLFITRKVLPMLKRLGVDDKVISQIMVANPRRYFEGSGT